MILTEALKLSILKWEALELTGGDWQEFKRISKKLKLSNMLYNCPICQYIKDNKLTCNDCKSKINWNKFGSNDIEEESKPCNNINGPHRLWYDEDTPYIRMLYARKVKLLLIESLNREIKFEVDDK